MASKVFSVPSSLVAVSGHRGGPRALRDVGDVERLVAGEPEWPDALAVGELQGHDAHPDEVRAVDALVALRDRRAHPEQARALRGPVA